MSYTWARSGLWLHSSCADCGLTYTGDERDLLRWQRGHGTATCVQRRAAAARALAEPDLCHNGHDRAKNAHADNRGWIVCDACRREQRAAKKQQATYAETPTFARVLATGWTRLGEQGETAPGLTPGPPLSTPIVTTRKEAVDS